MSGPRLPDFLIIGAPKSGTTSLYHYLQQHPGVWMPPVKEPHWFLFDGPTAPRLGGPHDAVRGREMIRRWEGYLALFKPCPPGQVCGEASVRYLYSEQACAAIRRRLPDVRLIAILRQPADRAYSAYRRDRLQGSEPCPTFKEAIADGARREQEGWLRGVQPHLGLYARSLRPWFEAFEPSRIRVYLYDDLVADPAGLIEDLYRFIGVDDTFRPDLSQRFNVTGVIENPVWRFLWHGTRGLRSRIMPIVPMGLRGRFFGFARLPARKGDNIPLDPALRSSLTEYYRDDIRELAQLLDRKLDGWLEAPTLPGARKP